MKNILMVLGVLLGLCSRSSAQMTNAQSVKIVVPYLTTCSSQTIGTSAVEMTGNTAVSSTTAGISAIKISNLSSSATVCCSSSDTVVCTVGSSFYVEPIFPSSSQPNFNAWGISTAQKWYCAASSANVSVSKCLVR